MSNKKRNDKTSDKTSEISQQTAGKKRSRLSRREFLGAVGSTIAASSMAYAGARGQGVQKVSAAEADALPAAKPNILFIITDQERYPRHWPIGWAEANLPAHNRLSQHGLTFRRHFCSAAMCSPSRSTLFTGLHPAQHGVINTLSEGGSVSDSEPTLPFYIQTMGRMLATAGYHVVLKGKWHMTKGADGGTPSSENVAAYGWQEWEPNSVANDTKVSNFGGGCADWDGKITTQAIEFLSQQTAAGTAEQPFMLTVGLGNPHDVLSYPQTWDQHEDHDLCDTPDNYRGFDFDQGISIPITTFENLDNKPTCQSQVRNLMELLLGAITTPEEMNHYVNFYAGLVKKVDGQINQILDAIPEEIRDNTIVIFTSDHGEMAMAHGVLRQKAFQMYEETVNVPLIIHNPLMFPIARETDAYAALIDLMPTIATLAQVPNPENYTFMGTDLTPLFTNPHVPVQNEILFTFDDIWASNPNGAVTRPVTGEEIPNPPKNIRAVFTQDDDGEWKYARYFDVEGVELPEYEMYHLRNGLGVPVDPFEVDNLANEASAKYNDPAIVTKREQLAQRLAALEQERLQPLPVPDTYLPFIKS
ncbi:MAG: sulfatase-like hydrolase/transferase [Candidatus Promineifilaceae bacterium]|nr:sulfatase-like hydrolase/transferase [Candidatus Promineifilaceae bacterium]